MTEPERPVRPDVWSDPAPDVVLPAPGRPLDLSQDPDRVPPAVLPPSGQPLDLSQDPDRVQPGRPVSGLPPAPFPAGVPLDPRNDPDRVRPGDRTLIDLLGDGAQEEARDGYTWLVGLLAVLLFLAVVAYGSRFLGP
ncbi:MAG: hypothetical protein JWM64_2301 [Frankiales bacterium]|nr:hypothetical protein [Frankiales bacterium]